MTAQGSAHGRFTRAIAARNLFQVESALRELRYVSLLDALDYLDLLAEERPAKPSRRRSAGGRLELEAGILTWPSRSWPLAALASCARASGRDPDPAEARRRAKPTLVGVQPPVPGARR